MPTHPPVEPGFSLLNRFTALSALILFVGAVLIGGWVDRRIYQIVTEDSIELASVFVDSTIAPHLAEMATVDALTLSQAAHLQQLIANNVASGRYAAVNLWSPEGKLVYSTQPTPPAAPQSPEGLRLALEGQVSSFAFDTVQGAKASPATGPFLESYFPVRDADGAPLAVIDLYQNLAELERSTLEVRRQTWLVVGTATALMFFLLFGIVRQGSETIATQQAALASSRRQIQQAAVRAAELNEAAMRRLGADLHDGPAQDLGIALMRIEPLRTAVAEQLAASGASPSAAPAPAGGLETADFDLQLIHTALQSSLQEIRNLASGLRLPELTDLDLAETVRKAAADYMRKTGRTVAVEGPDRLAGDVALKSAVYRLVQESLNNGHQHGEPHTQTVRYAAAGDCVQIEIGDDGKGFDPDSVKARGPRRQLGLAGLQERIEILGGQFEVRASPGKGTLVRAVLPLPPATTYQKEAS
jgi:signal transduction histidine kinase